jgi:hypothetical protein
VGNVQVEPLFLDPQSSPGKPDLIIKTPQWTFAVQCKSEDPSRSMQLPYDLFQYFAGLYQRAVEDSGKSYHLNLQLKNNIDLDTINLVFNRISILIKQGISTVYPWRSSYYDLDLFELGDEVTITTIEKLRNKVLHQKGDPLYHEFVKIIDSIPVVKSPHRLSSLFISGTRGKELENVIKKATTESYREYHAGYPLVIAVHLYQEVNFQEFGNRPSVKQKLIPWTDMFFKERPEVTMIFITSNHELYAPHLVGTDQVAIKHMRNGWVLESPEWNHNDVAGLGI